MQSSKLQIAIKKNSQELVSIFEVPTGSKCNCKCPHCGETLIAKNKNKIPDIELKKNQKIAHFSHESGSDCPSAIESAIHLLCKKILTENPTILIPEYKFENITFGKEELIVFNKADTEEFIIQNEIKIKPDAILYDNKSRILIEFYKTHAVDNEKLEKIIELEESCIEIDVRFINPLKNGIFNTKEILDLFQKKTTYKKWIYNNRNKIEINKYIQEKNKKIKEESLKNKLNEIRINGWHLEKIFNVDLFHIQDYVSCKKNRIDTYVSECEICDFFHGTIELHNDKNIICSIYRFWTANR